MASPQEIMRYPLSPERDKLFRDAQRDLRYKPEIYRLGDRFEGLPNNLAPIYVVDTTRIPGCHYGANNVFVPIIRHLEEYGQTMGGESYRISPETAILVEPSTGNGWIAFYDATKYLGYNPKETTVIIPDGIPDPRYRHPKGEEVNFIRTPAELYAVGMPRKLKELLIGENFERMFTGEKLYVSPNHADAAADITVEAMSALGRDVLEKIDTQGLPISLHVSVGNGSSLVSLGGEIKKHRKDSIVRATESVNYGGGYDWYAREKGLPRYYELFGIDPGHPKLLEVFEAYGTNVPIFDDDEKKFPLHERAIQGDLVDEWVLFANDETQATFRRLEHMGGDTNWRLKVRWLDSAFMLPNYSRLPQVLYDTYGNSTLANIAVASRYTNKGECVVAMAYDGRGNY